AGGLQVAPLLQGGVGKEEAALRVCAETAYGVFDARNAKPCVCRGKSKGRGCVLQRRGRLFAVAGSAAENDVLAAKRFIPQAAKHPREAGPAAAGRGASRQAGQPGKRLALADGCLWVGKTRLGLGRKPPALTDKNPGQAEVCLLGGPALLRGAACALSRGLRAPIVEGRPQLEETRIFFVCQRSGLFLGKGQSVEVVE